MIVVTFALLFCCFSFAKAEYCGYYNGYQWYCYDSDTYCCGFQNGKALCCPYNNDPFYTWWYFWLGILGFIFLVSFFVALCRRRRLQNERRQLQNRTTTIIQQQAVAASYPNPNYSANENMTAPPPYPVAVVNNQKDLTSAPPAYNPQDYPQFQNPQAQLINENTSG